MRDWKEWSTAADKVTKADKVTTIDKREKSKPISKQKLIRSKNKPPAARSGALFLLGESEASRDDLSVLIDRYLTAHDLIDRRDRALLTELVYGIFRQRGYLDWQIDQFSRVSLQPAIRNILRLGLYQLLFLTKIPPSAAVNTSVELAKAAQGIAAGRLVNGLLRNVLRQKNALPTPDLKRDPAAYLAVTTSHPEWMVRRWLDRWGFEKTEVLCRLNNEIPPTTLRANRLKIDRDALARRLQEEGATVSSAALLSDALFLKGVSVSSLRAYREGLFYVQDEGAQLISYLVDPQPGEEILDYCAAPGGKTSHLAELSGGKGRITATDLDRGRIALTRENLGRLQTPGVSVEPLDQATAANRRYDRILIDAPCSSLGILRRIPEGKWRKKPTIISDDVQEQRTILEGALPHLKVGGRLIYATCSTEPEENEAQAAAFEAAHPELTREDPRESLPAPARRYVDAQNQFTTRFNSDKMDQFFAVRWVKVR
ncbi:MAG: 16S rRNA (cytosine(967)-C(5))-methyltransferase RsmB [Nitrospirae bacterium]|nr:16S rRNA (cytosine(967)-C(5))-methyltransferase RsmB [Candidatus Manganitrophaceae bacterium]